MPYIYIYTYIYIGMEASIFEIELKWKLSHAMGALAAVYTDDSCNLNKLISELKEKFVRILARFKFSHLTSYQFV